MAPRNFNAFAKPIDGITNKTSSGGAITVLASSVAALLFLSQIILYCQVDVRHTLDLAPSFPLNAVIPTNGGFSQMLLATSKRKRKKPPSNVAASLKTFEANRVDVFVHVTFPNLNCKVLDYSHNNAKFSTGAFSKENGLSKFTKRRPTEYDYTKATGQSTGQQSKKRTSENPLSEDACTIRGRITVPRIGGDLAFYLSEETFRTTARLVQSGVPLSQVDKTTGGHNVSHYIHEISFGDHFPLAINPLKDKMVKIENETGIALNQIAVKLVPTTYKQFARARKDTYQLAVSNYIIAPELLMQSNPLKMPGLSLHYDYDPVSVNHVESRENFFVFLSSLIGIVGGVFVTIRLVSSMLVNTAQIMKKMD
mmetsp:Transcript_16534/g.24800  ORF Transcript_16534/g.24800 Transcript_16534/m.24800 type:complete len:367 (-) Transcript_16534:35-1135(-)